MKEEKVYLLDDVKEEDFIAHGVKEVYCDEVKKDVEITMLLKRPQVAMNIHEGWHVQEVIKSTCPNFCQNRNCKYVQDFKFKEQK